MGKRDLPKIAFSQKTHDTHSHCARMAHSTHQRLPGRKPRPCPGAPRSGVSCDPPPRPPPRRPSYKWLLLQHWCLAHLRTGSQPGVHSHPGPRGVSVCLSLSMQCCTWPKRLCSTDHVRHSGSLLGQHRGLAGCFLSALVTKKGPRPPSVWHSSGCPSGHRSLAGVPWCPGWTEHRSSAALMAQPPAGRSLGHDHSVEAQGKTPSGLRSCPGTSQSRCRNPPSLFTANAPRTQRCHPQNKSAPEIPTQGQSG